jgi:hypothetical protein
VGTASYKTARVSLLLKRFLEGKIKIIVGEKTFQNVANGTTCLC